DLVGVGHNGALAQPCARARAHGWA
ncbi:hypothetical protein, partial [Mycobacterium tuberculosis]